MEEPPPVPLLYNKDLAEQEKRTIQEMINKCTDGGSEEVRAEQRRLGLLREHKYRYGKFWDKSYVCKLSEMKKHSVNREERMRMRTNMDKSPLNILIFNGKIMEYLKKLNNNGNSALSSDR